MPGELEEGTEIVCPLCRDESTIYQRNKSMRPYFLCRQFQAPVNLNAPLNVSEEFLIEFVVDEEEEESSASETDEDEQTLQDLLD